LNIKKKKGKKNLLIQSFKMYAQNKNTSLNQN